MAKYIWVGRTTGATSTTQEKVDQYCFNVAGNWLVDIGNELVGATRNPGYADQFYIGGGISLYGNANYPGYTFAKSPCLYGGFSGNVALGTWSNTSTTSTGTTYTTAAYNAYLGDFGYPFPWIGGGISGDIRRWCAYRDGVSFENAAAFYTTTNSSGFRNPSQNLKLKVANSIATFGNKYLQPSSYDAAGTPELHTQNTKFIIDFDSIQANRLASPAGAGDEVGSGGPATTLDCYMLKSGGLRIRGGAFYQAKINTNIYTTDPSTTISSVLSSFPEYLYDAGIELHDVKIFKFRCAGWSKCLSKNCIFAHVQYEPRFRGVTYYGYGEPSAFGQFRPVVEGTNTQTFDLNNSLIDAFTLYDVLYGINEPGSMDGIRDLYFGTLQIIPLTHNLVDTNPDIPEAELAWGASIGRMWTANDGEIYPGRTRDEIRKTVAAVRIGGETGTCKITRIEMRPTTPWSCFIPVSIQVAGNVDVGSIEVKQRNRLEAADDIAPNALARIGEVRLSKRGVVDLGTRGSHFRNWYIGGLSGGSGAQEGIAYGGILFEDDFNGSQIRGGPQSIYWSTQSESWLDYNVRQPNTKVPVAGLPEPLE
jgi:hypothetical protein